MQFFCQSEKVFLLNCDFSASWECFRSVGNFSQLEKNLVPETGPNFL